MWTISKARNRKGFTLIELMIVVAIIIILAAIAIPNYLRMTRRAKIAAVQSDLKSIGTAIESYNTDWGTYPQSTDWDGLKGELTGSGTTNTSTNTTITGEAGGISYISSDALTAFENKIDGDPTYTYDSSSGTYTLSCTVKGTSTTLTMTDGNITASSS